MRFEEGIREVMLEGGLGWRVQVASHMAVTDLTVRGTRENSPAFKAPEAHPYIT